MRKKILITTLLMLALALALAACGGGGGAPTESPTQPSPPEQPAASKTTGDVEAGKKVFITCSACHGPDGKGMPGLGKDLTNSEFVKGLTDDELVDFIKVGRGPSDPANTTGVAMPPKGGNPALTDQDLYDVVAYIRTLQQ